MSDELHEESGFPGSIVTWTFYIDEPEGERKLRQCLDAPDVLLAVRDFERWLQNSIDSGWREVPLESVRDRLFSCFLDNDVTVPGWK